MRKTNKTLVAACLFAALAAPAAAQGDANAVIRAATAENPVAPEQRIGACDAPIKAARNVPEDVADALVNRGAANWEISRMKRAYADFIRALALDPRNSRAHRERANAFRSDKKRDRALADATEAVRIEPRDALAYGVRGNALNDKGEYDRAIADYNRAIKSDPTDADAWNNRGAAWRNKGDIARAMADYREALRINPKFDIAAENLETLRLLHAESDR